MLRVRAYAKVNLTLSVLGMRSDGYHLLHSYVQSVDVADELLVEATTDGVIRVLFESPSGHPLPSPFPERENLAWKAAERLRSRVGRCELGAVIRLRKGIPVAAGMGGGSTDAAAVLRALNRLWNVGAEPERLAEIGLELGADVPYCLTGGLALMEGIGERVTPLPPPGPLFLVLVHPNAQLSTAAVYRAFSGAPRTDVVAPGEFLARWRRGPQELAPLLHNDLQVAAVQLCPDVGRAREALFQAGALAAVLSGSGPTVFGLARDDEDARRLAAALAGQGWRTTVTSVRSVGMEEVER